MYMSTERLIESIVNIDSSTRNIYPKHVYNNKPLLLNKNPLQFTKDSNLITIECNNHNLKKNDTISLQNCSGLNFTVKNLISLVNDFDYAILYIKQGHQIDLNYRNYTDKILLQIDDLNIENNDSIERIENIPINDIFGIKQCFLYDDIVQNSTNKINLFKYFNKSLLIDPDNDLNKIKESILFIKLSSFYYNAITDYFILNNIITIKYFHINGIQLSYINANYPLNGLYYQDHHTIHSIINRNVFQIKINQESYSTNIGGGDNIIINKIDNSLEGFSDANQYTVNLNKTFNNVIKIDLLSMELPYVDLIIKKNINDKLYWKLLDDGNYIYQIQLDEGFYTPQILLDSIKLKMNTTKRKQYTVTNKLYNIFDINIDKHLHIIKFNSFSKTSIPNGLTISIESIDNKQYYILTIFHENNILNVGDEIEILESSDLTININNIIYKIDSVYINKKHSIYTLNSINYSYNVIIGETTNITTTISDILSYGGENVNILYKIKSSFLFNYSDTIGELLGFSSLNTTFSITPFEYEISNQTPFILSNNLNSVGNTINYSSGFMNLTGKYNYVLMYLNDIEYIHNSNLEPAFGKILLAGNPGDILFNTHVETYYSNNIYSKSFPINNLVELKIKFVYPDGSLVNFRNINHSFTLKITEKIIETI